MKYALLFALPLLASCTDSGAEQVKRIVGQRLKDPESAIFSGIRLHPNPSYTVACGTVNAKNSFGAYEGETSFIKYTGIGVRFEQPDDKAPLSSCCDVLMTYTPAPGSDVEDAPGYAETCGRLDLFGTLR